MASDRNHQLPIASGSHSSQPPHPDFSAFYNTNEFLSDEKFFASLCADAEDGLELVGTTTTPLHAGHGAPDPAISSNVSVHPAPEDLIRPSQSYASSEYNPVFDFHENTGNLLLPPASDAPYPPGTTHIVSPSSGYGPSQAVSDGPPVTASTSGKGQANPSTGLRIFHSPHHSTRNTTWRAETVRIYSIEITRHCLGQELWEKWNGRLYINRSICDDADALYLRIDAQTSEPEIAPSDMCEKCQNVKRKPFPHKLLHKSGRASPFPETSHLSRIYCNWPLAPLKRTSDVFGGEISFYVFCHPSHRDDMKCSLKPFRMIATLYKADATALASYPIADEIISRTIANNSSTTRSRSGCRNPQSFRVASAVPTTAHFAGDEGEPGDNYPDPPELPAGSVTRLDAPSDVGMPFPTLAITLPVTPSITEAFSAPLFFNLILPQQGYSSQRIKFYGATFSPTVDFYARFGELEPTPLIYRNPGLLEGEVPERDKTGPVPVSIVTKEGYLLCYVMQRFVYIGRDRKNAEEGIKCTFDEVDSGGALPDAKDTTRHLHDSKKADSACGPAPQGPSTQTGRHGSAGGDGAGAQDEMHQKILDTLDPTSELFDIQMQSLIYRDADGNILPVLFPPSRSWTDASMATTATMIGASASFKEIKATSRKPNSKSIVSRWLSSSYGSENSRKRKRTRGIMDMEATDSQLGVGGSLMESINLVLSPEEGKVNEEDLPVVLMDDGDNDRQAASSPKRRRIEVPL